MAARRKLPSYGGVEIPRLSSLSPETRRTLEIEDREIDEAIDQLEETLQDEDGEERPSMSIVVQTKAPSSKPPVKSIIPPSMIDTTRKKIAWYGTAATAIVVAVIQLVREVIAILKVSQ